jgi:integrase/recombinase XerD
MSARPVGPLLRRFFVDRLIQQSGASPATVATYRDVFRLFLQFSERHFGRGADSLTTDDFTARLVLAFLDHLERDRSNSARTRNARLAALRSFAKYVALQEPTAVAQTAAILAIPLKRHARPMLGYVSREEMQAILDAPNPQVWSGRRDRALFTTLYNTGARVSEALDADVGDFHTDRTPRLDLRGKGRKQRSVPLWRSTIRQLTDWVRERGAPTTAPLFPNRSGERMSRSGAARRLALAVEAAATSHPSLKARKISPHTLRHTTAMHLLQAGNDISVIALWLGHESPTTTHAYLEADLVTKQKALARLTEPHGATGRPFRASGSLLQFLESL